MKISTRLIIVFVLVALISGFIRSSGVQNLRTLSDADV